ncbi:hypothetical protein O9992_24695 [Vibrio lentus]|nr:hypothetical protein [Vibrio lentus]
MTSVLLAGLSGSTVADAATLVSILYPMVSLAREIPEAPFNGLTCFRRYHRTRYSTFNPSDPCRCCWQVSRSKTYS